MRTFIPATLVLLLIADLHTSGALKCYDCYFDSGDDDPGYTQCRDNVTVSHVGEDCLKCTSDVTYAGGEVYSVERYCQTQDDFDSDHGAGFPDLGRPKQPCSDAAVYQNGKTVTCSCQDDYCNDQGVDDAGSDAGSDVNNDDIDVPSDLKCYFCQWSIYSEDTGCRDGNMDSTQINRYKCGGEVDGDCVSCITSIRYLHGDIFGVSRGCLHKHDDLLKAAGLPIPGTYEIQYENGRYVNHVCDHDLCNDLTGFTSSGHVITATAGVLMATLVATFAGLAFNSVQ